MAVFQCWALIKNSAILIKNFICNLLWNNRNIHDHLYSCNKLHSGGRCGHKVHGECLEFYCTACLASREILKKKQSKKNNIFDKPWITAHNLIGRDYQKSHFQILSDPAALENVERTEYWITVVITYITSITPCLIAGLAVAILMTLINFYRLLVNYVKHYQESGSSSIRSFCFFLSLP